MQCPIDGTQLVMTDRQGVEIDYCPKCRGVWLDRGELDKIIDRAAQDMAPPADLPPPPPPPPAPPAGREAPVYQSEPQGFRRHDPRYDEPRDPYHRRDDRWREDDDDDRHGRYRKKRRKSILSEIFDFD